MGAPDRIGLCPSSWRAHARFHALELATDRSEGIRAGCSAPACCRGSFKASSKFATSAEPGAALKPAHSPLTSMWETPGTRRGLLCSLVPTQASGRQPASLGPARSAPEGRHRPNRLYHLFDNIILGMYRPGQGCAATFVWDAWIWPSTEEQPVHHATGTPTTSPTSSVEVGVIVLVSLAAPALECPIG